MSHRAKKSEGFSRVKSSTRPRDERVMWRETPIRRDATSRRIKRTLSVDTDFRFLVSGGDARAVFANRWARAATSEPPGPGRKNKRTGDEGYKRDDMVFSSRRTIVVRKRTAGHSPSRHVGSAVGILDGDCAITVRRCTSSASANDHLIGVSANYATARGRTPETRRADVGDGLCFECYIEFPREYDTERSR